MCSLTPCAADSARGRRDHALPCGTLDETKFDGLVPPPWRRRCSLHNRAWVTATWHYLSECASRQKSPTGLRFLRPPHRGSGDWAADTAHAADPIPVGHFSGSCLRCFFCRLPIALGSQSTYLRNGIAGSAKYTSGDSVSRLDWEAWSNADGGLSHRPPWTPTKVRESSHPAVIAKGGALHAGDSSQGSHRGCKLGAPH